MTNRLLEALEAVNPTHADVMEHSVTFSPIRWKTGWPHHLRRVPPFRDDARASITRAEVFEFAADVVESGFAREQIIDFLGACFAYRTGQTNQVMTLQAFLRNKGNATKLLSAIRGLSGTSLSGDGAVDAYASLTATGLAPKFASAVVYFLAGEQGADAAGADAAGAAGAAAAAALPPAIICGKRATMAGLENTGEWTAEEYAEYLSRLAAARDEYAAGADAGLTLDAVEFAAWTYAHQLEAAGK